jgi:hypothetical protein
MQRLFATLARMRGADELRSARREVDAVLAALAARLGVPLPLPHANASSTVHSAACTPVSFVFPAHTRSRTNPATKACRHLPRLSSLLSDPALLADPSFLSDVRHFYEIMYVLNHQP